MLTHSFLTITSVIAFVFGIGFLLIPTELGSFFNVTLTLSGVFTGQLFGATLVGFGVLDWLARNISDKQALGAVVLANLVGDAIGFVIALLGQLGGVGGVNQLGWSTVVIYFLLAAGFAYFQFAKACGELRSCHPISIILIT